jgi:5-hydroxyisourate hydrolase
MKRISTHVLDVVMGKPAAGIAVRLERYDNSAWIIIGNAPTDMDGRFLALASNAGEGLYRLTFATGGYLEQMGRKSIYPEISITFRCAGEENYHLPLLLSDNSYTTYRGS